MIDTFQKRFCASFGFNGAFPATQVSKKATSSGVHAL
jgi:hypothetical protein